MVESAVKVVFIVIAVALGVGACLAALAAVGAVAPAGRAGIGAITNPVSNALGNVVEIQGFKCMALFVDVLGAGTFAAMMGFGAAAGAAFLASLLFHLWTKVTGG